MKTISKIFFAVSLVLLICTEVHAQSLVKKSTSTAINLAAVTSAVSSSEPAPTDNGTNNSKINWDKIPEYHVEIVKIVDENGTPILNEDGTEQIRYFLVDQDGNKRSAKAVKDQNTKMLAAIGAIAGKVGIGALAGALSGGKGKNKAIGAGIGAAAGLLASTGEINRARKHMKSLKKQKKLIEAYSNNFTAEGLPIDAQANLSKIKDLNLDSDKSVSATTASINQELSGEKFVDTDDAWEI